MIPVYRFTLRNGEPAEIAEGSRIAWTNPVGIGGVTIAARVTRMTGKTYEGRLGTYFKPHLVGMEVEPCHRLRGIVERVIKRGDGALLSFTAMRMSVGMGGRGGQVVVAGYAFEDAARRGDIVPIAESVVKQPPQVPRQNQLAAFDRLLKTHERLSDGSSSRHRRHALARIEMSIDAYCRGLKPRTFRRRVRKGMLRR